LIKSKHVQIHKMFKKFKMFKFRICSNPKMFKNEKVQIKLFKSKKKNQNLKIFTFKEISDSKTVQIRKCSNFLKMFTFKKCSKFENFKSKKHSNFEKSLDLKIVQNL
jgi:hypothetical protein